MSRVASWLLNGLYLGVLALALPWLLWAAWRQGKYREGFAEKFWGRLPRRSGNRPCVWLHAVSVGEVNLLGTLLGELTRVRPEWQLVITTTTKAGYELACQKYAAHTVAYCPLDFSWAVANALRRIRPDLLVLAELELWPNLITAAARQGTRVAIVNGRLSDRSFRGYRRLRPLVARILARVDRIAAQNEETAERFRQLGARPAAVHSTGSLKFDGATLDRRNPRTEQFAAWAGFEAEDVVLLAGSTQEPEEAIAVEIFRRLQPQFPRLRLVLVPRHPQRFEEVARLLLQSGLPWVRRSQAAAVPRGAMLLVDSIGELGAWWGTATIGFVGGSFGNRGGQNMLEPAAYGVATAFGPNTWNFRDIVAQLRVAEGALVVQDAAELEAFVRRALEDPTWASALGSRARQVVLAQQGATRRTVDLLIPLVETATPHRHAA